MVSVVIPAYNAASFLKDTIASVLSQSLTDFEILVVDDGSTDDTSTLLKEIKDKRLKSFYQKNAGVSSARNHGISKAKGKYVSFLDADDLFLNHNLEEKVKRLESSHDNILVHGSEIIFESESGVEKRKTDGLGGNVTNELLTFSQNVIHSPSSVVIRKSDIEKNSLFFDMNLSLSADWEYWVRASRLGRFEYVDIPLTKYRIHESQMHWNVDKMRDDMDYAFNKGRSLGWYKNDLHYRYCRSKFDLILSGSYYKVSRNFGKAIYWGMSSLFKHPKPLTKKLIGKIGK